MDELNKFSKRFKRYTDLGTSAGSIALNFIGTKVFNKEHKKNAEDLTKILGNLKGPIMKIAQLLSTVPDLLPQEYITELTKLQSSAPPMGWNFVKRRMRSELGVDWEKKFIFFDKEPFAAASLGVMQALELKHEKLNVHGGAVAMGHPLGASGCRIVLALIHALKARRGKRGFATACLGGGMATAIEIET